MSKPRVFVTRIIPDRGLQKVLAQTDATVWQEELPPPRAVLLDWARQADGLLTLLTDKIDAELMDAAPNLKVVANFAVGFDNFDVPSATQRSVLMTNTPGVPERMTGPARSVRFSSAVNWVSSSARNAADSTLALPRGSSSVRTATSLSSMLSFV